MTLTARLPGGIGVVEQEAPTRAVNDLAQAVITVGTWMAVLAVLVVAYRMGKKRGSWLPLAMVLAAAVNSFNEPLFDKVFHLYWYEPGQWTLFDFYGYPQPVWITSAYILYFSVPGLYIFRRLCDGASREWAFKAMLVTAVYGAVFESTAMSLGLYTYFGDHAFRVLTDYPLWLGLMEGAHITIWSMLLAKLGPLLKGRAALLAVPMFAVSFCSIMFGAGGAGLAAINVTHTNPVIIHVATTASLLLALTLVWVVGFLHPSEKARSSKVEAFVREHVTVPTPAEI